MKLPNRSRPAALLSGLLAFGAASHLGAQEAEQDIVVLSPFTTFASEDTSLWAVDQSSGGTRIAVPVKELPFTLDVLSTTFMEDFIYSDVGDVLAHVGNVSGMESYSGAGSGNAVRGFPQYYQLRNGFYRNGVIDRTLVARVEVIKGPYAAIYGRGEPGGVINYISKKPVFDKMYGKFSLEIGENATQRVQLEQNIPISSRTALLLAGSYGERDFDQQFTHERSRNFGAVLRQRLGQKTEVTLEYEHMFRRNNRGRPAIDIRIDGTDPSDGSRNKYTGEWAYDFMEKYGWVNRLGELMYSDRTLDTINATLVHQFTRDIGLRVAYNDSKTTQDYDYNHNAGSTIMVDPITREFTRWDGVAYPFWRQLPSDVKNIQADLTVKFNTGEVNHTTLLTFDYNNQLNGAVSERGPRGNRNDVYTVDYGTGPIPNYTNDAGGLHGPRTDPIPVVNPEVTYRDNPQYYTWLQQNLWTEYDITGLFLTHRARFFDNKLLAMAGGRFDSAKTTIENRLSPDKETVVSRTQSKVDDSTYNFGLNYYPTPNTIVFGSYSTSFNPKGDVYTHTLEPLPNERGEGYELGIRSKVLGDKFDVGLSYFQIERQNIRIRNPDFEPLEDDPSEKPQFIAGGLDRAKGFEVYANGKLTKSLSVRFSGGTVNAKHVKSLDAWKEGLRLSRVPEWNYSVGGSYRVPQGKLRGLSLNASYRRQSAYRTQDRTPTANDYRNNLRTEEGGVLDLSAGYGWRTGSRLRHNVRVAMKNALNDVFIEGSGYFSMARQVTASYTLDY